MNNSRRPFYLIIAISALALWTCIAEAADLGSEPAKTDTAPPYIEVPKNHAGMAIPLADFTAEDFMAVAVIDRLS